jgi:hypothetical protein
MRSLLIKYKPSAAHIRIHCLRSCTLFILVSAATPDSTNSKEYEDETPHRNTLSSSGTHSIHA